MPALPYVLQGPHSWVIAQKSRNAHLHRNLLKVLTEHLLKTGSNQTQRPPEGRGMNPEVHPEDGILFCADRGDPPSSGRTQRECHCNVMSDQNQPGTLLTLTPPL